MALDTRGVICKYILFASNVIFALLGFSFLVLGFWIRFGTNTREIFETTGYNTSVFAIAVMVQIILGVGMLVVTTFGNYGACREKRCALIVFSVLLVLLAAAGSFVGFIVYCRHPRIEFLLKEYYGSLYFVYTFTGNPAAAATLFVIHNLLQCCGITGVTFIEVVWNTCPVPDGSLGNTVTRNCIGVIGNVFESKAPLLMVVFCAGAAFLIITLVCAIILCTQLKRNQQNVSNNYSAVY